MGPHNLVIQPKPFTNSIGASSNSKSIKIAMYGLDTGVIFPEIGRQIIQLSLQNNKNKPQTHTKTKP